MSCTIDIHSNELVDWTITSDVSNKKIMPIMFKNYEYAGAFSMKYRKNRVCQDGRCDIKIMSDSVLKELNKGNSTSVKTTDGYFNFHTHPFPCYDGEKTVWGWPSGEDMRECVGFSLRGNLFHMIYTLEGIYTVQVNPNFLSFLQNDEMMKYAMPDSRLPPGIVRGTLVSLIESYFRATHGHRTKKYNSKFGKHSNKNEYGICLPQDWINYTNNFTFENLYDIQENKCSAILPCNSFPEYSNHHSGTIDLQTFLQKYGVEVYDMDTKGVIRDGEKYKDNVYNYLMTNINSITNFLQRIPNLLSYGDETWEPGQWFHTRIFYNKMKCGKKFVDFNNFLNTKIKSTNVTPTSLCNNIFNFWKKCENDKSILFPDVTMKFKPFKPKTPKQQTCEIFKGTQITDWVKHHFKQ